MHVNNTQTHEHVLMRGGKYGKVLKSSYDFKVGPEGQAEEDRPLAAGHGGLLSVCCFKAGSGLELGMMRQSDRKAI